MSRSKPRCPYCHSILIEDDPSDHACFEDGLYPDVLDDIVRAFSCEGHHPLGFGDEFLILKNGSQYWWTGRVHESEPYARSDDYKWRLFRFYKIGKLPKRIGKLIGGYPIQ